MKISVLADNFKKALSTANRAVASKSTLPVLSNVLLQTKDGALQVSATNLDAYITTPCGAKVEDEGAVTLPAKLLSDWVAGVPNDVIEMTLDDKSLSMALVCGKYRTTIHGIEADEFPVTPAITTEQLALFTPDELKTAIAQSVIAAADNNNRPALAGVSLQFSASMASATFSAADGHRLASKRVDTDGIAHDADLLVPASAMSALSALIGESNIAVSISDNAGLALFDCDGVQFTTRLIDAKFPDWRRIVPDTFTTRVILETTDLQRALKLSALVFPSGEKVSKIVKLTVSDGLLTIKTTYAEVATNETVLECSTTGDPLVFTVNIHYLIDAVASCKSPQVALELQTAKHPCVVKPIGADNYTHIVLPMVTR